jgi:serine/threonine-protein kinase
VLFDFIGKGGMAEIFLARQKTDLGATRLCVVKQILPGLAGDPQFSDMLVHEAKLAARLSHANVVQVFDLGRADERLFIAMEYVEGFDLNDLLKRCSKHKVPMPFELGVHVVREALRGLDYAHRRVDDEGRALGVVHRDVSPSNLLVSFDGEVKVCDFGIAHANDVVASRTSQHEIDEALRGKAGYMSPEHAQGKPIDARADVFAAGIVLWELAAGRRMYRTGEGRDSLLEQARNAEIPPLPVTQFPQGEQLKGIVDKALAADPEHRYTSAAAMLRDLEGYAAAARLMTSHLRRRDRREAPRPRARGGRAREGRTRRGEAHRRAGTSASRTHARLAPRGDARAASRISAHHPGAARRASVAPRADRRERGGGPGGAARRRRVAGDARDALIAAKTSRPCSSPTSRSPCRSRASSRTPCPSCAARRSSVGCAWCARSAGAGSSASCSTCATVSPLRR